jgi:CHAT domain-containing protein/Tfp pilus assembly protein PilF
MTSDQRKVDGEAERLWHRAQAQWNEGQREEAVATLRRVLDLTLRTWGPWTNAERNLNGYLAVWSAALDRWEDAASHRRRLYDILVRLRGEADPRTVTAKWKWAEVDRLARSSPEKRRLFAQAEADGQEGVRKGRSGDFTSALAPTRRALASCRVVLGDDHPVTARHAANLSAVLRYLGRLREALPHAEEAAKITVAALGSGHPETAHAVNELGSVYRDMGRCREAAPYFRQAIALHCSEGTERSMGHAVALNNLALCLQEACDYARARELFERSLAISTALGGPRHPEALTTLANLARLLHEQGRYDDALAARQKALRLKREARGTRDAGYISELSALAVLLGDMGRHADALRTAREAHALAVAALDGGHPNLGLCENNLARLLAEEGDHAAALDLARRSVERLEKSHGSDHPLVSVALRNLSEMLLRKGDYAAAAPLLERAARMVRATSGEDGLEYARVIETLGSAYLEAGDLYRAERYLQRAMDLTRRFLGEDHPHFARTRSNFAHVLLDKGRGREALAQFRRVLPVVEKASGPGSPEAVSVLTNMAMAQSQMEDHEAAVSTLRKALAHARRLDRQKDRLVAVVVNNLASSLASLGRHSEALPLASEAIAATGASHGPTHPNVTGAMITASYCLRSVGRHDAALLMAEAAARRSLAWTRAALPAMPERQQLGALQQMRRRLDALLAHAGPRPELAHSHALAWKGLVFDHQMQRAALMRGDSDEARSLAAELLASSRRLATLEARGQRIDDALAAHEELEQRLSSLSAAFRAARGIPGPGALSDSLPEGAVLIDYLAHGRGSSLPGDDPQSLLAWVIRRGQPPVMIRLGPIAPIEEAITAWRKEIARGREGAVHAQAVHARIWKPILKYLAGASRVIVSPDGPLSRIPFAALPGSKPGRFLLEDLALTQAPVPRLLAAPVSGKAAPPSLLVAGGLDYGEGVWDRLAATGPEAADAAARFRRAYPSGTLTSLDGRRASRDAILAHLPRHAYVHLATHGLFAPAGLRDPLAPGSERWDRVSGLHPGLMSGLVLSGASSTSGGAVLTALEVAGLDLSAVRLAVLSACETGLGKEAGGEGLLGLQRAFAVAGCRAVVGSLWRVDDPATSVLMERFYFHLWEKKLPAEEALRQAQLDVLRGPELVRAREAALIKLVGERALRGLGPALPAKAGEGRRSAPAFWAAFVLSGDGR